MGIHFRIKNINKTTHQNILSTMAVLFVLEGTVKADQVGAFKDFAKNSAVATKAEKGCEWVKAAYDKDSRYVLIVQNWVSEDDAANFVIKQQGKPEVKAAIEKMMEPGTFRRRELSPYGQ